MQYFFFTAFVFLSVCFGLHIHPGAFIYEPFFLLKMCFCTFTYFVIVDINHSNVHVHTVGTLLGGRGGVLGVWSADNSHVLVFTQSINYSRGNMRILRYCVILLESACACVCVCVHALLWISGWFWSIWNCYALLIWGMNNGRRV